MVVTGFGASTMPRKRKEQAPKANVPPKTNDTSGSEPSETVRVPVRVMDMIREICHRTKDERGKRLKLNHYVLALLEPLVLADFQRVMAEDK